MRIAWLGVLVATTAVAHADEPRMLKGPYLQDLAPTSITVMWHFDQAVPAHNPFELTDLDQARIANRKLDAVVPPPGDLGHVRLEVALKRHRVEAGGVG